METEQVIQLIRQKKTQAEIAEALQVSRQAVNLRIQKLIKDGEISPDEIVKHKHRKRGYKNPLLKPANLSLKEMCDEKVNDGWPLFKIIEFLKEKGVWGVERAVKELYGDKVKVPPLSSGYRLRLQNPSPRYTYVDKKIVSVLASELQPIDKEEAEELISHIQALQDIRDAGITLAGVTWDLWLRDSGLSVKIPKCRTRHITRANVLAIYQLTSKKKINPSLIAGRH